MNFSKPLACQGFSIMFNRMYNNLLLKRELSEPMQLCKQGNIEAQGQLSEEMYIYKLIPTNVYNKAKDEVINIWA